MYPTGTCIWWQTTWMPVSHVEAHILILNSIFVMHDAWCDPAKWYSTLRQVAHRQLYSHKCRYIYIVIYLSGWLSVLLMFEKFEGQIWLLEQCLLSQCNIHEQTQMYMTQINGGIYIPNDKRCIPTRFITGGWRLFHHSDIICVLKHFIRRSLGCLFNYLTRLTTKHHQCPELLVLCSGNRWYLWIDDFITWYLINTCMCNEMIIV